MTSGAPDSEYTQFGTLKVAEPAAAAEVLDVPAAGGGPGGSAAALRARELGLTTAVIDADDLLTKIRDFHEGKDIEPDYGRGSEGKPVPPGGALITALHFEKWKREEMLSRWRGFYKEHSITARIGAELTGLERQPDGVWLAKVWSRRGGQEFAYRARNVILALGSVARRFDIPGDLNGINFRLDRAENFVGGPALVVGGGISAAEAVIAISNAKVKDSDRTAVYWSYHGEALPRVAESKALGAAFYDAYVGNGNIRYLARSDPAAIFAGPDDRDYLSVRIDRKIIEGRPIESVHLEFAKERVIACIGADLPFQLIETLGAKVPMVNDKRWMLINQDGELSLPNVFLIGDARGGKFLRCTDFNNQDTWEWITGPAVNRNIKNAMWEGVLAVETVAVRAGNAAAKLALLAAPALTGKRLEGGAAAAAPAAKEKGAAATPKAKAAAAKPPAAAAPAPQPATPPASIVSPNQSAQAAVAQGAVAQLESLLPDGSVEAEFPLGKATTTIGRSGADISSPGDVHLSNLHASVVQRGDDYVLEDAGSSTGTWLRVQGIEGRPLAEGDVVWLGAQILMASKGADGWAVAHYDGQGNFKSSYPVGERGIFIGRGAGIALDESDASLSRRHAQFRVDAQGLKVFDLASKNGTLVRLSAPTPLRDGDEFRVGTRRYRFERVEAVAKLKPSDVVVEVPAPAAAAPAAAAPAAASAAGAGGLLATIEHAQHAAAFPIGDGQDILHGYFDYVKGRGGDPEKQHKKPLDWSCLAGTCGLCLVHVLDGADSFEPVAAGSPELDTLENRCFVDPDPKQYRLACKAKIKGPVKLGIVE